MLKTYIGVKMIQAEPQERDGKPGYKVVYQPDGYTSWSPKDVFEAAYLSLAEGDKNKISQDDVDGFIAKSVVSTLGEKTTIVQASLLNGFEMVEGSSCVDPANYDEAMGGRILHGADQGPCLGSPRLRPSVGQGRPEGQGVGPWT